jgi:hypothetical protein
MIQSFVNEAVLLYEDEELWLQAQKNGIDIINHRYLRGLFEDDFKEKLNGYKLIYNNIG